MINQLKMIQEHMQIYVTGHRDDSITGLELDYNYFKSYNKIEIAIAIQ